MVKTKMPAGLQSIKLPMTDTQMRKLAKGQGVRINPMAGCTAYDVWCNAGKCKRMAKMMEKGKGFQLKFDPEEMEENVEIEGGRINWRKIGRTLRSTAKAVGKFYREKVRPTVGPKIRAAVTKAIEEGIPLAGEYLGAITGQPEIVAAASSPAVKKFAEKTAKSGADKLSKLTGAFGVKKPKAAPKKKKAVAKAAASVPQRHEGMPAQPKPAAYRAQLQDNFSPFLNPKHPAMHPVLPTPDNSLPLKGRGLYMDTTGMGLFLAQGGGMGSPMDPQLPPMDNSTYY